MKDAILILGALGGIVYLGKRLYNFFFVCIGFKEKYNVMKRYYEKNHDNKIKVPMGFKTESERSEIEDRIRASKAL